MSFSDNLRTLRLTRGLTQPALAEKAGIEQSYLSKLENGRSRPSEDVLTRLAQALDVKLETLQNGDETEERSRRWLRGLQVAGVTLALGIAFFVGRASALYPLSVGQVISGANAHENLPQQLMGLAPKGVEVIMLSEHGRAGEQVAVSGRAVDMAAVEAYTSAIRGKFGGSFTVIQVSPAAAGEMHAFSLDYVIGAER